MQRIPAITLFILVCLFLAPAAARAQDGPVGAPPTSTDWSAPAVIYDEAWPDPLRFSLNDDATRLVALIPDSGNDDTSRHIVVSEFITGTWQPPIVIAQNGAYSDAAMQWLPQQTHPVISGDGTTIAYVGYTGTTFGVYIANRLPEGGWSDPALLNTGLANTHYRISLSRDGNTLAFSDYPFLGIQQLYLMVRQAGVWGAPQQIGAGGNPSLSADGRKLAFVSNARVAFVEQILGAWSAPQILTGNDPDRLFVENPQMSGDGRAIYYWLVDLVPAGNTLIRTAQNLFVLRREGVAWSAPQQVNAAPLLPSGVTDSPAAANHFATRLIYTRPVTTTDPGDGHTYVSGSHLEASEWVSATWQTTRLVESNGFGNYNKWPRLTPDGKTLIFDGGSRYVPGELPIYGALWQITTTVAPPLPAGGLSISGLFSGSGGSLFSAFDNIHYLFAAGTFSDTVTITHTFWPNPPPPPVDLTGIGGIGGIGGLGGAFSTTLLGPGGLPVQPLRPVTVTIDYSNTDTGTAIPGSLSLWWLHLGLWARLPGADDPGTETLTAQVDHFSQFAVFGETNRLYLPCARRE
jgi:hypothetical protein